MKPYLFLVFAPFLLALVLWADPPINVVSPPEVDVTKPVKTSPPINVTKIPSPLFTTTPAITFEVVKRPTWMLMLKGVDDARSKEINDPNTLKMSFIGDDGSKWTPTWKRVKPKP